jgi:hypothetical protein
MHVSQASLDHDLDGLGADVDRRDGQSSGLHDETVKPASGADVEHVTPAESEGCDFDGGELGRRPEEMAHRQRVFDAVIAPDDELGCGLALKIGKQRETVGNHRIRIHRHHLPYARVTFYAGVGVNHPL